MSFHSLTPSRASLPIPGREQSSSQTTTIIAAKDDTSSASAFRSHPLGILSGHPRAWAIAIVAAGLTMGLAWRVTSTEKDSVAAPLDEANADREGDQDRGSLDQRHRGENTEQATDQPDPSETEEDLDEPQDPSDLERADSVDDEASADDEKRAKRRRYREVRNVRTQAPPKKPPDFGF